MSGANRKKPHRCFHHPRNNARGRCSRCGNWICSECALLYRGQLYCAETCGPTQANTVTIPAVLPAKPQTPLVPEPQAQPQKASSLWSRIILGSAWTLAISGLAVALWSIREIRNLKTENLLLREKRLELIALVKKNNLTIAELRSNPAGTAPISEQRISLPAQSALTPAPSNKKSSGILPNLPDLRIPPDGIPVSFNNGAADIKLVSLTFDGGSHANAAADILDTLRSRDVKSTMFLTGEFVRRYPDVVQEIATSGHELGNHMADHPHLTSWETDRSHRTLPQVTPDFVGNQLIRAEKALLDATGLTFAPLWRAPYGEFNASITAWAKAHGYLHVGWGQGKTWRQNLDSNDWIPNEETPGYRSPREVMEKIMSLAETKPYGINGGIVLMHLGTVRSNRDQQVHLSLGALIDSLRAKGYEFSTVSEMARRSGVNFDALATRKRQSGANQERAESQNSN